MVANMVDIFMLLMLTGAGDDLQGIKKGVLEIAELIAINKADGDNKKLATRTCADVRGALNMFQAANNDWLVPVMPISGYHNIGLDKLWQKIQDHQKLMHDTQLFEKRRAQQQTLWFKELLDSGLRNLLYHNQNLVELLKNTEIEVANGNITAFYGQQLILSEFAKH